MALADEPTLDPVGAAAWDDFRSLAHRMVDDMLDHLSTLDEQPAWRPLPDTVRRALGSEPLPIGGVGAEAAYDDFKTHVLRYTTGNVHPRFWGWVQGNGTVLGMMAAMLAAGMNSIVAGFDQSSALVEHRVLAWLAELMGFPPDASGLFVSGTSTGSTLALAVARHGALAKAGFDPREHGLQAGSTGQRPPHLVCYGSAETHGWARKAVELLGLGNTAFVRVPVDSRDRMNLVALDRRVREDKAKGVVPFAIIATVGTVNTGAIDDVPAIANVAGENDLWLHVDGAFGALARLSDRLRPLVAGLERADSLAFDLHKWGYLPFECGCLLVRDAARHRETFANTGDYMAPATRGVIAGGLPFAERGLELTRDFKALKVWLSLKSDGVGSWARLIEQNVNQARYLADLVQAHPALELLREVTLNIVCFRYAPTHVDAQQLNPINVEIVLRLQERGIAVPSGTLVDGHYAIRCAIVNHRSRYADFEALVDAVVRIGDELRFGEGA
jgi:aromatic-L-amino-acid decarboxylase